MTPGDTLTHSHCIIDLFSSLGFPDLETGFVQGGVCQLWLWFFSSSRLSGFGNRVVQGGSFFLGFLDLETGSWKGGVSSLGFPDLETGFMQGGGCRYTQGGCRSTKLRHRHCPKSTVSSIILVPSAFRIWKQGAVSVICRGGRCSKLCHRYLFQDFRQWIFTGFGNRVVNWTS